MPVSIELTLQQDQKGRWIITCPFCEWNESGSVGRWCAQQLEDHMNENHNEGRCGSA